MGRTGHRVTELILGAICGALACGVTHVYGASPATRPANAEQEKEIRKRCIESLHAIRKEFEGLVRKHGDVLSYLGPGQIDEANLSLHFPLRDPSTKPLDAASRRPAEHPPARKPGISVWFELSPPGEEENRSSWDFMGRWPVINVSLYWSWSWSAPFPFPAEIQYEFQRLIRQAVRPLAELEATALAADISRHGEASYPLRGEPGIELTIRRDESPRAAAFNAVGLYVRNTTDKIIAIRPGGVSEVVEIGTASTDRLLPRVPALFPTRAGLAKDPFIYLSHGEEKKVCDVTVGRLEPGEHVIRVIQEYADSEWLDLTPTYLDGAPIRRRVENAWKGILVSQQLTITVSTRASAPETSTPAR
jgi:hypothetical protein